MNTYYQPSQTSVVLLAAGFGKRMLPLTSHTPKPLLKIGNHTLIEHHLKRLRQQGFKHVVINIAHLAKQIPDLLGDGENYGLIIEYSDESDSGPLETAGGLQKALQLIKSDPFLCINADIWTDFDFRNMLSKLETHGRLLMVGNPEHNPAGDFHIKRSTLLTAKSAIAKKNNTYSGIALYQQQIFTNLEPGKQALAPVFNQLIRQEQLQGVLYEGVWNDIGTPQRLAQLNQRYKVSK